MPWTIKMRGTGGYEILDDDGQVRASFSSWEAAAANHAFALQSLAADVSIESQWYVIEMSGGSKLKINITADDMPSRKSERTESQSCPPSTSRD